MNPVKSEICSEPPGGRLKRSYTWRDVRKHLPGVPRVFATVDTRCQDKCWEQMGVRTRRPHRWVDFHGLVEEEASSASSPERFLTGSPCRNWPGGKRQDNKSNNKQFISDEWTECRTEKTDSLKMLRLRVTLLRMGQDSSWFFRNFGGRA